MCAWRGRAGGQGTALQLLPIVACLDMHPTSCNRLCLKPSLLLRTSCVVGPPAHSPTCCWFQFKHPPALYSPLEVTALTQDPQGAHRHIQAHEARQACSITARCLHLQVQSRPDMEQGACSGCDAAATSRGTSHGSCLCPGVWVSSDPPDPEPAPLRTASAVLTVLHQPHLEDVLLRGQGEGAAAKGEGDVGQLVHLLALHLRMPQPAVWSNTVKTGSKGAMGCVHAAQNQALQSGVHAEHGAWSPSAPSPGSTLAPRAFPACCPRTWAGPASRPAKAESQSWPTASAICTDRPESQGLEVASTGMTWAGHIWAVRLLGNTKALHTPDQRWRCSAEQSSRTAQRPGRSHTARQPAQKAASTQDIMRHALPCSPFLLCTVRASCVVHERS